MQIDYSNRIEYAKQNKLNKQETQVYLIEPLLYMQGIRTDDLEVFRRNYALLGTDTIDCAMLSKGRTIIAFETKSITEELFKFNGQFTEYFKLINSLKLGVLTNGKEYCFYTSSSTEPFLVVDITIDLWVMEKIDYTKEITDLVQDLKGLKSEMNRQKQLQEQKRLEELKKLEEEKLRKEALRLEKERKRQEELKVLQDENDALKGQIVVLETKLKSVVENVEIKAERDKLKVEKEELIQRVVSLDKDRENLKVEKEELSGVVAILEKKVKDTQVIEKERENLKERVDLLEIEIKDLKEQQEKKKINNNTRLDLFVSTCLDITNSAFDKEKLLDIKLAYTNWLSGNYGETLTFNQMDEQLKNVFEMKKMTSDTIKGVKFTKMGNLYCHKDRW